MVLIRGFEDLIQSLFLRGEIYGTTHLYTGQEAVAVGVASVLEDRDRLAATYRGHGHALALGVDPQSVLDEMLGRATGVNGGRAGSMNINSPKDRLVGSFGIVGGTIAAATGVGLAVKRVGGVAVCQFGDGAVNQGYFYECLNFCAVLRLPVVFLCENNGYGEYTPFQDVTAGSIRGRAEAMDVPAETVDGMSVVADARSGRAGRSRTPGRVPALPSSRRSRTATSGTPAAIPAPTGRPASSTCGRRATRFRGCAGSSWMPGSMRRSSMGSTARSRRCSGRWSGEVWRRRSRTPRPAAEFKG